MSILLSVHTGQWFCSRLSTNCPVVNIQKFDWYILLRYIIYNIEIARPCHQLNAVFCSVRWVITWLHVCVNFVTFLNFPTTFPPLMILATMMQTTTLATSATPTTTTSAEPMQWPVFLLLFLKKILILFLDTNLFHPTPISTQSAILAMPSTHPNHPMTALFVFFCFLFFEY